MEVFVTLPSQGWLFVLLYSNSQAHIFTHDLGHPADPVILHELSPSCNDVNKGPEHLPGAWRLRFIIKVGKLHARFTPKPHVASVLKLPKSFHRRLWIRMQGMSADKSQMSLQALSQAAGRARFRRGPLCQLWQL